MESSKGTLSSITGAGSTQPDDYSNKDLGPTPSETGLQSRGQTTESGSGSFLGNIKDMVNTAGGAGTASEKNEGVLDKGSQDNGSTVDQAKDEQISDFLRDKYKSTTSSDFPGQDN
jgi:hypothetical protein